MNQTQTKKNFSSFFLWEQTFNLIKSSLPQSIQLVLFAYIVPKFLLFLYLAYFSEKASISLEPVFPSSTAFHFPLLISLVTPFFSKIVLFNGFEMFYFGVVYCALVKLSCESRGNTPITSPSSKMLFGLKTMVFKGFFLLVTYFVLSQENFLFWPMRFLAFFVLIGFVIFATEENRGYFFTLKQSLFLRFINPEMFSKWQASWFLIGFAAMVFIVLHFLDLSYEVLLSADEWLNLPASAWKHTVLQLLPLTWMHLLAKLLITTVEGFLVLGVAFFTTCFYFMVDPRPKV